MTKPLIQIDDIGTTREMTDEEFADYETIVNSVPTLPDAD
jgi:hypothetical protein